MNLTQIIDIAITLIFAVVTAFVIPWLKTKLTAAQADKLTATIRTFCKAAEQLHKAGVISDRLTYVENALKAAGYVVDVADVTSTFRAQIEAAVDEINKSNYPVNPDCS